MNLDKHRESLVKYCYDISKVACGVAVLNPVRIPADRHLSRGRELVVTWELTPSGWGFLFMAVLGVIGIILVLLFDRPKTPKTPPAEGKGPSQQP